MAAREPLREGRRGVRGERQWAELDTVPFLVEAFHSVSGLVMRFKKTPHASCTDGGCVKCSHQQR